MGSVNNLANKKEAHIERPNMPKNTPKIMERRVLIGSFNCPANNVNII